MGSGYYPIKPEFSEELLTVLKKVKKENEQIAHDSCCGNTGQYDNSFYDGCYVTEVRLAIKLLANAYCIRDEINNFEPEIQD